MKDNETSSVGVFLIQDTLSPQHNGTVDALRLAVAKASVAIGIHVEVVPDVAVATTHSKFKTTYFVSSTLASHSLVHSAFEDRQDVVAALLVAPSALPGFDPDEDQFMDELRRALRPTDRLITDSVLSRSVVEANLAERRASVEVVNPDFTVIRHRSGRWSQASKNDIELRLTNGEGEGKPWSFGSAKGTKNQGVALRTPGLTWGRESSVASAEEFLSFPEPREYRRRPTQLSAAELAFNEESVRRVFHGRLLSGPPLRIGVLGHKLSFIDELSSELARHSGSKITLDEWRYLSAPSDSAKSLSILQSSDVVIGEWARPNNVWIQNRVSDDTRLIVRAHRYEVTTDFPARINMDRYDAAVVIVPWVGRTLVQKFGWPAEKMVFIPNFINRQYFTRPKLEGAEFTLGMVGITPHLKRVDFALDLLSALRRIDPRFNLRIRGSDPLKHPHWSTNAEMRAQWGSVQTRLRYDATLRGAVFFDPPGRDMASWYEQVGCILSLSDLEGSHVALAEGIASGAIAVARRWPGIETLWPEDIIFDRFDDAVAHILEMLDSLTRAQHLDRLSTLKSLDPALNLEAWWSLVNGDRGNAQKLFGEVDWQAPIYEPVPQAMK